MKLRLRSFETKETLKVEVPNPCSLQHLQELACQKLPAPSSSSAIYFSLNQKDKLITTSPEESIQSIGITSGDLVYFTTNLDGFSRVPQIPSVTKSQTQTLVSNVGNQNENLNNEKGKTLDFSNPSSEEVTEPTEIDDGKSVSDAGKSFSVPGFLRKVFTEEVGDDGGFNHKLLRIAVRAVLLESGFVEIDSIKRDRYTLPNIINNGEKIETINIKFQNLGKFCKVYGSLINGPVVHSVLLDEDRLVPFLNVVWANCGKLVETMEENNRISSVQPEKEVFEFWRKIKDIIALPLLIDLCDKTGLELPPCFMRLPTELKLTILESVSGVDLANVSCVCTELRYLASSDDLWKQKFIEQFGNVKGPENGRTFKERFVKTWEGRKKRKNVGRSDFCSMRRNLNGPFGFGNFPRILGGDYDLLMPNVGPLGLRRPGGSRSRNVMPNCNLGGLEL